MIKYLSYVSCAARNVFPINSLPLKHERRRNSGKTLREISRDRHCAANFRFLLKKPKKRQINHMLVF